MKNFFIFIIIVLAGIVLVEFSFFLQYGETALEEDPPQFKYQFVDIYKPFFKKIRKAGQDICVPQKRVRNITPEFPLVKASNTIRIFIIGGSVAQNLGEKTLKRMLDSLVIGKNFEIINCGMGAYDSYRVLRIEKEILSYSPDIIIIISGNNEFYNEVKINLFRYYANKFLRKFWIYRKAQVKTIAGCRADNIKKQGKSDFRPTSKRLDDYKQNIRWMVKHAKKKAVFTILCTIPVNFSDCPPMLSVLPNKDYLWAKLLLEQGKVQSAIDKFNKFLQNNPEESFGYYWLGKAYEKIENYEKAKQNYIKSLDMGFLNGRASYQSNEILRQISQEEKIGLAKIEAAFINRAKHGLLGREQFSDNCHWYLEYNTLVAQEIIKAMLQHPYLLKLKQERAISSVVHDFLSLAEHGNCPEEVEGRMISATWEAQRFSGHISERTISYLETLYLMNKDALWNMQFSKDKIKTLCAGDVWIKEFMDRFEKNWPRLLYHIGETYRRLKLYDKALVYFNKAISLNREQSLAYIGCALTYHALGAKDKAKEHLDFASNTLGSQEAKYYKEIFEL